MTQTGPTVGNVRGRRARKRLLGSALSAFALRGFHGTTTREIAEAAGMSPAAMYAHYPTKEQLLFELSQEGHIAIRDVLAAAAGSSDNPAEQLRRVAYDFAAWHVRSHRMARVVQYEMSALTAEHATAIAELRRDIQHRLADIISDGVEKGMFAMRSDPAIVTLAILSLGIDVARWYRDGGTWGPTDIASAYGDISLQIVGYTG